MSEWNYERTHADLRICRVGACIHACVYAQSVSLYARPPRGSRQHAGTCCVGASCACMPAINHVHVAFMCAPPTACRACKLINRWAGSSATYYIHSLIMQAARPRPSYVRMYLVMHEHNACMQRDTRQMHAIYELARGIYIACTFNHVSSSWFVPTCQLQCVGAAVNPPSHIYRVASMWLSHTASSISP